MTTRLAATIAVAIALSVPACAHRLDEYLEATLISVEKDRVHAQLRLAPGVAVFPFLISTIDTDADGLISSTEQRSYAERVLRDLSLSLDGNALKPRLVSVIFPPVRNLKEGVGEILLEFEAAAPPNTGPRRRLIFENRHLSAVAAYLVNCLIPRDPGIRVTSQSRTELQSFYELDSAQPVNVSPWWSIERGCLGVALFLFIRLALLLWRRDHAHTGSPIGANMFGYATDKEQPNV